MFDGLEMGIFPLVASSALAEFARQAAPSPDFVGHWIGVINACFLLGAALGGLIFGWLGDRLGRVRAMILSVLAYSAFTGLIYFATSAEQLAACRFLAAIGMGGEWSLGVALVMEAWPGGQRPLMAGLIGAAGNLGYALVAVIGIGVHITADSWRWMMVLGAAPALLTLLIARFVPESERWHRSVARAGLVRNPLGELFGRTLRRRTLLAIGLTSVALMVTWGSVQIIPTWIDVDLTHRLLPKAKAVGQLASSLGAILGCLLAPLLGARFGRRPVYFGLCLASLVSCLVMYLGFATYSAGLLAMIFVVGACTASFYGWLPHYLPELFPTRVRATGQGIAYNSGRLLAAAGAWHMGALMAAFHHSYAKAGATFVFVYVLGMILIWFAPETRGEPLPE